MLAVSPELEQIFRDKAFAENFRDILDYRTIDYYRRRYIDSKAEGILLFTKKVDKSLLKDGFAIPQKEIEHMLKAIGVTLNKGGKHVINIELDGMTYQAQLTSLDFGSKYQDQVRYGRNSEICEKMVNCKLKFQFAWLSATLQKNPLGFLLKGSEKNC